MVLMFRGMIIDYWFHEIQSNYYEEEIHQMLEYDEKYNDKKYDYNHHHC